MTRRRGLGLSAGAVLVAWLAAAPLAGQTLNVQSELVGGAAVEEYLRALQLVRGVDPYPWSLRNFSPREIQRLGRLRAGHPWEDRLEREPTAEGGLEVLRAKAGLIYNSSFPFGTDQGAVWAGRGFTAALEGGVVYRSGIVTAVVAPTLVYSQNGSYDLREHTLIPPGEFLDGWQPRNIDLPQRFGSEPFVQLDPGQSELRVDYRGIAAGLSTATQNWGPAAWHPLVLGDNAPGFLHAFIGTGRSTNVGIGRVQARIFWGRLGQSSYSPVAADSAARFATGLIGVFTPAGAPNVEIGATRFFHTPWTSDGLTVSKFTKTFEGFLKAGIPGKDVIPDEHDPNRPFDPDNQLASVFFRWLLPNSGFELYGELARDDHSWDTRDLALEPDHSLAYMLGLAKGWSFGPERLLTLRGELLEAQVTILDQVRPQAPFYVHGWTRQGHTHRGQLLGSPAGYGGAAVRVQADLYHPSGRLSARVSRELRQPSDDFWLGEGVDERGMDVVQAFGVDLLHFRGNVDYTAGFTAAYNFNRNFDADQLNFRIDLAVRAGF